MAKPGSNVELSAPSELIWNKSRMIYQGTIERPQVIAIHKRRTVGEQSLVLIQDDGRVSSALEP